MKALFISDGKNSNEFYQSSFSFYTEGGILEFVDTFEKAKEFLIYQEKEGGPEFIDIIICTLKSSVYGETAVDFYKWLRTQELTYYSKNFQARSIPILLIDTREHPDDHLKESGFKNIINLEKLKNPFQTKTIINRAIRTWVDRIRTDYDLLRIDAHRPSEASCVVWNRECEILTRFYALHPIRVPFLISKDEPSRMDSKLNYFASEIERLSKITGRNKAGKGQEDQIHDLLMKETQFLLQNRFVDYLHEKTLMGLTEEKSNLRLDFVRFPYFYKFSNKINILEIKRPKHRLMKTENGYKQFSSKLHSTLAQIRAYRRYFLNPGNETGIKEIFTKRKVVFTQRPELSISLLMGNSDERDEFADVIPREMSEQNYNFVSLVTYGDLILNKEKLSDFQKLYILD